MPTVSRHGLTLLLLGLDEKGNIADGLGGITRLQKYLFLLEKEVGITPTGKGFQFTPYKAGPYSTKIYDDLEFLENLGYIESQVTAEATEEEAAELEELNFEDLMADSSEESDGEQFDGFGSSDACQERRFILTRKGRERVKELLDSSELEPVTDAVRIVKSRFGHYSLSDLLYYIYSKYPEMAVESEIRDKILRRRHRT